MMRRPNSHGSLLGHIDPVAHSKRRRVWDRAFTPTAIKSYDPMLHARLSQLITNLNSRTGQPIDLAEWFGFFSLDFMGDFAYGGMFDFMARGEDTEGFHDFGMKALGIAEIFGTVPWIGPFVKALPSKPRAFQEMAMRVVEKRTSGGSQVRDLFHYLVGNYCCPFQFQISRLAA
jgi:cytochrome P450